ncbi:hypothetical protein GCM10007874_09820 [Labrys miyagiensis]|uniref:Bbp19-like phage domain-containing protein n=1 Tax=Labrys miyagiensis TaxID=346912 RepID=A0ABQ6CC63_9HYPH|nr:hypothetical protein [Labrys miyagiensis]GLS17966.1 hypothetical protein GCM10007874_09820 [Labrys miyagiensis]
MRWLSLSRHFGSQARSKEAELRLALAYDNLFASRHADAQLVLADLADFTGFYRVNGPGIPPDDRAFSDGMRAAFGRLFRFLNLTDEEKAALVEAARAETLVSANEGII